jgi:hypothetical protein
VWRASFLFAIFIFLGFAKRLSCSLNLTQFQPIPTTKSKIIIDRKRDFVNFSPAAAGNSESVANYIFRVDNFGLIFF